MAANPTDSEHSFWDFKRYQETEWFTFLVRCLLLLVLLYLVLHWGFRLLDHLGITNFKLDYEYAKLDDRQKQIINRIYFSFEQDSIATIEESKPATINKDSLGKDTSSVAVTFFKAQEKLENVKVVNDRSPMPPSERAIKYIYNELNGKIDSVQLDSVKSYLMTAPRVEAVSYLSDARFQVKSYFWLTGPAVYFEIVFWSLFGVLASLLFNLGLIACKSTTDELNPKTEFDNTEIPYQVAKLLYAPLCTLILILGYNFFSDVNIADISSSKGVIVFSFISGFYSSRVVAFLDRLKEVLLPAGALVSDHVSEKPKKSPHEQPGTIPEDDKPPLPPEPTDEPQSDLPEDEPLNQPLADADQNDTKPVLPVMPGDQPRPDAEPLLAAEAKDDQMKPSLPLSPGPDLETGNPEDEPLNQPLVDTDQNDTMPVLPVMPGDQPRPDAEPLLAAEPKDDETKPLLPPSPGDNLESENDGKGTS